MKRTRSFSVHFRNTYFGFYARTGHADGFGAHRHFIASVRRRVVGTRTVATSTSTAAISSSSVIAVTLVPFVCVEIGPVDRLDVLAQGTGIRVTFRAARSFAYVRFLKKHAIRTLV